MQSLYIPKLTRQFHISHTTFCKWLNYYPEGEELALADKPCSPGKQLHHISKEIEKVIMSFSKLHLVTGLRRISDELKRDVFYVGKTVLNIALKRRGKIIRNLDI
jgi:hypothetical protein